MLALFGHHIFCVIQGKDIPVWKYCGLWGGGRWRKRILCQILNWILIYRKAVWRRLVITLPHTSTRTHTPTYIERVYDLILMKLTASFGIRICFLHQETSGTYSAGSTISSYNAGENQLHLMCWTVQLCINFIWNIPFDVANTISTGMLISP